MNYANDCRDAINQLFPIKEHIAEKHAHLRDARISDQRVKGDAHRTHRIGEEG